MWLPAIDAVGILAVGMELFTPYDPAATLATAPRGR
jgi:hypothetical protein